MAEKFFIVWLHCILLIHYGYSVDGHLECFRVLAIMNSADMKFLLEHLSLIILGLNIGVELLCNYMFVIVFLCLTFWGATKLYSTAAAQFYTPTSNI